MSITEKTSQQRSDIAYRAVLAHSGYAGIDSGASMETQIEEMLKGMKVLCQEYGVNPQEFMGDDIDDVNDNIKKFATDELIYKVTKAVSTVGSYDPDDIMHHFEESLAIAQASVMWKFLEWAVDMKRTFDKDTMIDCLRTFYEVTDSETQEYMDGKEVEFNPSKFTLTKA